jgi:hypothetical protein
MVRVSGDLPQRDRSTSRALDDDAMTGNILNPNSCICLAHPSPSAKKGGQGNMRLLFGRGRYPEIE